MTCTATPPPAEPADEPATTAHHSSSTAVAGAATETHAERPRPAMAMRVVLEVASRHPFGETVRGQARAGDSVKVCAEPGCPELTNTTRCTAHTRAKDKARGTRQQRGYNAAHDRLRADYQQRMDAGDTFTCWRCTRPIDPRAWHLGHDDHDRNLYRGPECIPCNLATSARRISPHA